jgi:hypothetical protein
MNFLSPYFSQSAGECLFLGVLGMPLGVGRSVAGLVQNMSLQKSRARTLFPRGLPFTLYFCGPYFRVRPRLAYRHRGIAYPRRRGICSEGEGGREHLKKSRGKTAFTETG